MDPKILPSLGVQWLDPHQLASHSWQPWLSKGFQIFPGSTLSIFPQVLASSKRRHGTGAMLGTLGHGPWHGLCDAFVFQLDAAGCAGSAGSGSGSEKSQIQGESTDPSQ